MNFRKGVFVVSSTVLAACGSAPYPQTPPPAVSTPAATTPKAANAAPEPAKTPEAAVARLFTSPKVDAAWFSDEFVRAVPASKLQEVVDGIKGELGAFEKIEKRGDDYETIFANGRVPTKVGLDDRGRFASLWFGPSVQTSAPPIAETIAAIRALPGQLGVLVVTDGKDVAAHEADASLAVGSAFKLAILDVLRERIAAKRASWNDSVALKPTHKSLPSGFLQEWPDNSPLNLYTLAGLMISQSDNTATDALLDFVGRANVEKVAPGNAPFLSTREAFVLKQRSNAPILERFRAGNEAARRKVLDEIAKTKPRLDGTTEPYALDVEWRMSARKVCDLLSRNKSLPVMHINPGVATASQWDLVAFKGGSEPGVLNLSSWVEKSGHAHCVVTTWNDPTKPVDLAKLTTHHRALLAALLASK